MPPSAASETVERFATDVQYYLSQQPRQLPSRYLYDDLGSMLFEAICRLPWYPITRAEDRLLIDHGNDIARRVGSTTTIVELGSGSGEKLRTFLDVARFEAPLDVHLVDLSTRALELSARALEPFANVHVISHEARYEQGLEDAARQFDPMDRVLVLYLGSNIGNFDPPASEAFLVGVRARLRAGDAILLGTDLVKPAEEMLLAYDDPLGVTAAFNRNLLVRMNRELASNFDVNKFAHRAVWNDDESRIEMHLVSRCAQAIAVPRANLEFAMDTGDMIWTESSYKYRISDVDRLLDRAGFRPVGQWLNRDEPFALTLAIVT